MNPPKTAQIVKTRLLDNDLPTESLRSLSVTSGILKLKENENSILFEQLPKGKKNKFS